MLTGVFKKVLEKSSVRIVFDNILTQSDITRLRSTLSKPRPDDWKEARSEFDNFVATLNPNSHYASIIFADSKFSGLHSTIGQEWCGANMETIPLHIAQPCVILPSNPFATIATTATLNITDQLSLLNQFPAQCIMSSKDNANNLPLYVVWPCFAPKHTILMQSHNLNEIESSFQITLSNCRHRRVKPPPGAKKRKRAHHLAIVSHLNRMTKTVRVLMADDATTVMAQSFAANLQPFQQFQNTMVQAGHLRICKNNDTDICVIWNKFDCITSE